MTDLLFTGINFFNARRFFEAHEVWEDLWRPATHDRKRFYQGLIQAAVGMHHLSRHNLEGARSQLIKALEKLDQSPESEAGIDVKQLRKDLREVLSTMDVQRPIVIRIAR